MTASGMEARIRRYLLGHGDDGFRRGQRAFFRNEVDSFGVRGGAVKERARQVIAEVKRWPSGERDELMERLWRMGKLESGALVCHVMRRFGKSFGWREFLMFGRRLDEHVHNWAHAGGVASWLVAACVANDAALLEELWAWTDSPNRWKRRASAVSLLQEAKQGRHAEFILRVAKKLLPDRDDMVQKGVGWLLKETHPRKPAETVSFLLREGSAASRLTLRYAAEKMSAADRRRVLR